MTKPHNPFADKSDGAQDSNFDNKDDLSVSENNQGSSVPEFVEHDNNYWEPNLPPVDSIFPTYSESEQPAPPAPASDPNQAFPMDTPVSVSVPATPHVLEEPEEMPESNLNEMEKAYQSYPVEIQDSIDHLLDLFSRDDVSEVIMNGPATVMYKSRGERIHEDRINFGTIETYHAVINKFLLTYTNTEHRIGITPDIIEGQLELFDMDEGPPVLARVHIIAPPAKEFATVTVAKKSRVSYNVDDIVETGALTINMGEFLKALTRARVTTVISGVSGSGKTTLLEAMTHYFDPNDHIIVVEDTPELLVPSPSTVYLASRSARPGDDKKDELSLEWLVSATNRMRPDRIIVGEIRGAEMSEFLIAANSGADGSITTLHASTPRLALDKMLSLVMKASGSGSRSEVIVNRDIASIVDVVVQTSLIDGRHVVTAIEEVSNTVADKTSQISTQTLFEYDRNTGQHVVRSNPSTNLRTYMESRGVAYDQSWFQR